MFPVLLSFSPRSTSLPHRRGDVSDGTAVYDYSDRSSPQAWGCFQKGIPFGIPLEVFPTGVGMFLRNLLRVAYIYGLPHRRGDVSDYDCLWVRFHGSSPQAWGCFSRGWMTFKQVSVFPTGVGMFQTLAIILPPIVSLPHRRGDVSDTKAFYIPSRESSPQAWGCFLFTLS